MFIPNPLQLKAMLVAGAVMAIACLSLLVWGLYWRGEYRECKVANVVLVDQVKLLADKMDTQSAAVRENAAAGQAAVAAGEALLVEARKLSQAARRTAEASDAIARGAAQPGKDCRDAWREIEATLAAAAAAAVAAAGGTGATTATAAPTGAALDGGESGRAR